MMLSLAHKQELIDSILMKSKSRMNKVSLNNVYIEMKNMKSGKSWSQLNVSIS